MATVEERLDALEAQVAALTARGTTAPVTGTARSTPELPTPTPPPQGTTESSGALWALDGLKARLPEGTGAVLYTGTVRLDRGEQYDWQYGRTVDDLLAEDWSELAGALGALGHPVRLRLLREILGGRRTAADLAELADLGTSGQLYHHLRQLTAAGWLGTTGRGRYAVPADRVVPLLTVLAAARR